MPSPDRKPRPRRTAAEVRFTTEAEVRSAVAEVRALPEPERSERWRVLRRAVAAWVRTSSSAPPQHDNGWSDRVAMIYFNRPMLLPRLRPQAADR
jgi:hypothetical protein